MRQCSYSAENLAVTTACGGKMSGVSHIYLVPRSKVTGINWVLPATPTSFEEMVTMAAKSDASGKAVDLASSNKFSKIEFRKGHAELTYNVQGEKGGHSLKANLVIERNGFVKAPMGFYASALNEEYIMIACMNNGEYHLLGDMQSGMEMADDATSTSGRAVTDANMITFSFEWDCNFPQIFGAAFDPENGTGVNTIDMV